MRARAKKSPELPVPGWPRPYIRDGVSGLPLDEQQAMLEALGLDLSDDRKFWIDRLSRRKVSERAPLVMRDQVIDPVHNGETIYVAGLRVLGWTSMDVMRAAAKAFGKECRIYCADTGEVYSAETSAPVMLNALAEADRATQRARTKKAMEGRLTHAAQRVADGLAIARQHWGGPMSTKAIAALSGLSMRTLYEKLPRRSEARKRSRHA